MKIIKDILRFIISFLLMVSIVLSQFSIFERTFLLNSKFYKNILNNTEYFTLLEKEINFGFKNLSMETSIPEEVYTKAFSKEDIKKVSFDNIDNTINYFKGYTYKESTIDTKKVQTTLNKYIEEYAAKNNLEVSSELKAQMGTLTKDAGSILEKHGTIFNISGVSKYSEFQKFRALIKIMYSNLFLFLIIDVILMLALLLLNGRNKAKTALWIGSSMISASLMTIIPSVMGIAFKIPSRLNIAVPYLKLFLNNILLGYLKGVLIIGIISFLLGVASLLCYLFSKNDAK